MYPFCDYTDNKRRSFGATLTGRAHRRVGGNQDALARAFAGGVDAVAVADGCSAGAGSALGAALTARLAVARALRRTLDGASLEELPALVLADLVEELARLARACAVDGEHARAQLADALLATLQINITNNTN